MKGRGLLAVAVLAAVPLTAWLLAPPRSEPLVVTSAISPGIRGAVHVHTRRSDGAGTPEDVAAAAARAGLKFVILTDHGDATRQPDAPSYRHGVLVIDAVEISTEGGHLVALGVPRAPYPLGGEARDVVEDVARLGGFSIAAHPGSAKPDLRWLEWTAPIAGVEWLNGDSEWRDEPAAVLARVLFTYLVRAPESLGQLLDRPDLVLQRWDALTKRRRVVAVAAGDAHARVALRRDAEPGDTRWSLRLPGYEQVFRAFSITLPQLRLTGNAESDAAALIGEFRAGHLFSSVDSLAAPAAFRFTASSGGHTVVAGDVIEKPVGDVLLRVDANAPPSARIALLRDGNVIASAIGPTLEQRVPGDAAVYRVEVALPETPGEPPVPWVLSNPIYVGRAAVEPAPFVRAPAQEFESRYQDGAPVGWIVEKSGASAGALNMARSEGGGSQLRWEYSLGGTRSEGPFSALAMPAGGGLGQYERLVFSARANRPTRLSIQIRVPGGAGGQGERWHRSVYLDETLREVNVFWDEMRPKGFTSTRRPDLSKVEAVLFVAEALNTPLGQSNTVWLDDVRYGR